MKSLRYTSALLTVVLSLPAHAGVDPNKAIDFRADRLRVEGGKKDMVLVGAEYVQKVTVTEGETIGFVCDWSANLVGGAGYWKTKIAQNLQAVFRRDGNTFAFTTVVVPAGTQLGSKSTDSSGWKVPSPSSPSPYESSSTSTNFGNAFKGSTSTMKWTAEKPGKHEFTCVIPKTGFEEPTLNNNITAAVVDVLPKPPSLKALSSPKKGTTAANQGSPTSPPVISATRLAGAVKSGTSVPAVQAPVMSPVSPAPAALADIASDGAVTVGTKPASWGGIVAVSAAESRIVRNGMCEFAVRHVARNSGAGGAGAFNRRWTNSNVPGNWDDSYPPIPAGGMVERVDTLPLKPGRNVLYLTLDHGGAVPESNENNNLTRIAVDLSGECGAAAPAPVTPGTTGGRLKMPKP